MTFFVFRRHTFYVDFFVVVTRNRTDGYFLRRFFYLDYVILKFKYLFKYMINYFYMLCIPS